MHARVWLALVLMLGAGSGCSVLETTDQPAVLVRPGAAQQARIQAVIALALEAPAVNISAGALTTSSTLVIESGQMRRDGQRLQGRVLGRPEHFQLLINGSRCMLLHVETQRRHSLRDVRCRAHEP